MFVQVAIGFYLFQHMCTIAGEICIFGYFFVIYKDYRHTLYTRANATEENVAKRERRMFLSVEQTTYQENTAMMKISTNTHLLSSINRSDFVEEKEIVENLL